MDEVFAGALERHARQSAADLISPALTTPQSRANLFSLDLEAESALTGD